MSVHAWFAVAALVAGAAVLVWPARRRRVLPAADRPAFPGSRWLTAAVGPVRENWRRRPRWTVLAGAAAGGLAGGALDGPVLATVAAGYAALATRAAIRRAAARAEAADRARVLDDLSAVAADLRAGLPPAAVLPTADDVESPLAGGADRFRRLTGAVWRLAEQTGAPAADLVERIEADARAAGRARATAAAQAAGARATAVLLAALPAGGIAIGYGIGADPLAVLLHTPLGAGCAVGALALQIAGLAWCDRLATAGADS